MQKKFLAGLMLGSLMLVGAGCGGGAPAAGGGAAGGPAAVNSAFSGAQIKFTAKDKTAFAKQTLGADAGQLVSFTEYKFDGSSMILLLGEVKDPGSVALGFKLSDPIKAQASAASLQYSSVLGLKDPKWFAFILRKDSDAQTSMKVMGTISQ